MKCSNCQRPVEEGALFCNYCGQEIQWVPDYDSLGNYMEQERLKKKQAEEEAAKRRMIESKKRAAEAARLQREKKIRRKITLCIVAIVVILIAGIAVGMRIHTNNRNNNDFDYQMRMADTEFSNSNYEKSYEYVNRALELDSQDLDAMLLKSQIEVNLKKKEDAIETLNKVIGLDNSNVSAYGQLIKIYESSEDYDAIKELLSGCESSDVLTKYSAYICSEPVFSIPTGTYADTKVLVLYPKEDGDEIYYTTDGTEPTRESTLYTGSIKLEEGQTTVKAIAVNEKEIASDVVTREYTIAYEAPDPPRISPSSGDFTSDMDTKIYIIVPEGCRAYYAFDKEPTIADNKYTPGEAIDMPEGTHTFYAILVDEHNKVSEPGSATYHLED